MDFARNPDYATDQELWRVPLQRNIHDFGEAADVALIWPAASTMPAASTVGRASTQDFPKLHGDLDGFVGLPNRFFPAVARAVRLPMV